MDRYTDGHTYGHKYEQVDKDGLTYKHLDTNEHIDRYMDRQIDRLMDR